MQPSGIADYNLPSDHLTEQDINALKAELADPRIATDYWRNQINLQLDMKQKSERQAFANRGLPGVSGGASHFFSVLRRDLSCARTPGGTA